LIRKSIVEHLNGLFNRLGKLRFFTLFMASQKSVYVKT
jgi:hypothetical protein